MKNFTRLERHSVDLNEIKIERVLFFSSKVVCKNDKPDEPSDEEKYLIATSEQAIAAFHRFVFDSFGLSK